MTAFNFGLSEASIKEIKHILAQECAVERAILFGSRAKGAYRPGSDIDLALVGAGLDVNALGRLATRIEESSLPYQVDLCLYDQLDHPGLRDHIERVGKEFYVRGSAGETVARSEVENEGR